MPNVSRRDRFTDLAALLAIVVGVACYFHGDTRLRAIARLSYKNPGPPGQLAAADRARYTSNAGIGLVIVGGTFGVAGAISHGRRRPAS